MMRKSPSTISEACVMLADIMREHENVRVAYGIDNRLWVRFDNNLCVRFEGKMEPHSETLRREGG